MSRSDTLNRLRGRGPLIAPSMLKCDFGNLQQDVERLDAAGADVLHWDVMDAHFVPNLSYGAMVIERVRQATKLSFDAHLMISEPDRYLDDYIQAGCDAITFHAEAIADPAQLLRRIKEADIVAGLAINPGTPVSKIEPVLGECDLILVMSVEPGFGGQAFMPQVLPKVTQLRELGGSDLILSIDGGIAADTIESAATAGANLFVAGSAIFNADDYAAAIGNLRKLAG